MREKFGLIVGGGGHVEQPCDSLGGIAGGVISGMQQRQRAIGTVAFQISTQETVDILTHVGDQLARAELVDDEAHVRPESLWNLRAVHLVVQDGNRRLPMCNRFRPFTLFPENDSGAVLCAGA